MKKLLTGILTAALLAGAMAGVTACGKEGTGQGTNSLKVFAPDGAPALALASLLADEEAASAYDVEIVNATTIQTYVTGETPEADFCILPINAAGKLLGTGTVYQMLGTVTNGNLYFLKDGTKELPDLTAENFGTALLGKTLGVIQYEQVPGLTLRVVLDGAEVAYQTVESVENPAADKVNILPCTPQTVAPVTGCDYYLCPEPARTTKIGATQGKLAAAGSLQELYGGNNGYPQAVLVVKKTVISEHKQAVVDMISHMESAHDFLMQTEAKTLDSLLSSKRTKGMDAAFTEAQLNSTVLENCSVRFTKAADCKTAAIEFLTKFKAVSPASTEIPADAFFYVG